jgi:hypothetical protein
VRPPSGHAFWVQFRGEGERRARDRHRRPPVLFDCNQPSRSSDALDDSSPHPRSAFDLAFGYSPNDSLERDIAELLTRPVGRPSHQPVVWYYQAASWKTARRVVAKVEFHFGELFPRVGFIVTNLTLPSRAVVRFYNKRGTAEQWIKEGKQAVKMTRLSCHRFRSNEVRLWLSVIAYNLGNLWRRLALPYKISNWSLTSLQHRPVKTGGRLIKHARYYWLLLAESHLTRRLFGSMLLRIAGLSLPAGYPRLRQPGNRSGATRDGGVSDKSGREGRSQQFRDSRWGRQGPVPSPWTQPKKNSPLDLSRGVSCGAVGS